MISLQCFVTSVTYVHTLHINTVNMNTLALVTRDAPRRSPAICMARGAPVQHPLHRRLEATPQRASERLLARVVGIVTVGGALDTAVVL